MKTPKLATLLEDENFDNSYFNFETGVTITEHSDLFMILEYENYLHVYLHFDDKGEPPFRDFLAEGIAATLEKAQVIAAVNLNMMDKKRNLAERSISKRNMK